MDEQDTARHQQRARIATLEREIRESIGELKSCHPPQDGWGQALIDAIGGEILKMLHEERRRRGTWE